MDYIIFMYLRIASEDILYPADYY